MNAAVSYIIRFLTGANKPAKPGCRIGYTADPGKIPSYDIVIIPSPFFDQNVYGTPASLPELPLQEIEGVPLLFGTSGTEWIGTTFVIHADIIASTYFLITRYEEIMRRDVRDAHGRFPGKESLPYRAGFIHRPVVEEYGKLLRKWIRETGIEVAEPETRIRKIWLTHDIDAPFFCRSLRNLIRESVKGIGFKKALSLYNGSLEDDPYYTFPWLTAQDNSVREILGKNRCVALFFLKSGGKSKQDKPYYNLKAADMQTLVALLKQSKALTGLHSSYDAGRDPLLITNERKSLEKVIGQKIRHNRHHFLACREPEDISWLERAGITDDFTMGYADVAGFRLGTSRPVRWINPVTKRLSSVTLHPLSIMDVTLSEPQYMNLDYEGALRYCLKLIDEVEKANGELVLLWHNDVLSLQRLPGAADWHRKLYLSLLDELKKR